MSPSFLRLDPPEHDRLRRLASAPFHATALEPLIDRVCADLVRAFPPSTVDLVDQFAYPLPVAVICHLLGVPRTDEPRFHAWIAAALDHVTPDRTALGDLARYLGDLIDRGPADGLLADLAATGDLSREDLVSTAVLLLIAGHETTVNLIANSALLLLRQPRWRDRLDADPTLAVAFVEEVLRYDPPVHILPWRRALADIPLGGTTIPAGAPITLVLAAANRDPAHVPDPDRFDADRQPAQHLGFGDGIHYCFGAPLARLEAHAALRALLPVLGRARLLEDPPEYRVSAVLRGPRHLRVALD